MPLHRDIESLDPRMKVKVQTLIEACKQANIPIFIFETLREQDVQNAYYAQGRMSLTDINDLRKKAGLYELTLRESVNTITDSVNMVYMGVGHGNGTAVDIVPTKDGALWWNAPAEVWESIGKIGESIGLVWGGRWKSWDGPHFQLARS